MFDHKELSFKVRKALVVLQKGLAQEREETKQMLAVYHKYTRGEASEQEMLEANQQFRDVIKGLGLSVVVILPFSPITLPAIVKLGQKFGIEVLPSAFKEQFHLENDGKSLQMGAIPEDSNKTPPVDSSESDLAETPKHRD
ncbi:hypothetical protein [Planctobacterium marinum]